MAVVLVVEDEGLVRALAEMILHDAKHQIVSASNLEDAMSLLHSDRTIDVLFTDLNLGNSPEGGIHLAITARKLLPKLPVLYTTGQRVTSGMLALFVKPYGFLEKPYATDQLTMALGNLLRQGRKSR